MLGDRNEAIAWQLVLRKAVIVFEQRFEGVAIVPSCDTLL
ncbi:hypothetical protein CKA32_003677 [Geitlerinema sp. FC II]|nr:hypothetical protein CKA32_003677 [Geitlerinema sp. FC II]